MNSKLTKKRDTNIGTSTSLEINEMNNKIVRWYFFKLSNQKIFLINRMPNVTKMRYLTPCVTGEKLAGMIF